MPETLGMPVGLLEEEVTLTPLEYCALALHITIVGELNRERTVHSISVVEYDILRLLQSREEWQSSELANSLNKNQSTISRAVRRLFERDLVTRRRLPHEHRVVLIRLTEEGETTLSGIQKRMQSFDDRITEGIPNQELQQFRSLTDRVLANGRQDSP